VPDSTLYYLTDANHNVTSVFDADDDRVEERYTYEPYGEIALMYDRNWDTLAGSAFDNEVMYAGYVFDAETGLNYARNRYLNSSVGAWTQRDKEGYVDGADLYEYVQSNPITLIDPQGSLVKETGTLVVTRGVGRLLPGGVLVVAVAGGLATAVEARAEAKSDAAYRRYRDPTTDCTPKDCRDHHIASPYSNVLRTGMNIGAALGSLLSLAGIDINDVREPNGDLSSNGCEVCDVGDGRVHQGPHDPRYHFEVMKRLLKALEDGTSKMPSNAPPPQKKDHLKRFVDRMMNQLCKELNTPGNKLRDMVTAPRK
jgi:RHS repeat-associated protein